jgi:hypothetical protein
MPVWYQTAVISSPWRFGVSCSQTNKKSFLAQTMQPDSGPWLAPDTQVRSHHFTIEPRFGPRLPNAPYVQMTHSTAIYWYCMYKGHTPLQYIGIVCTKDTHSSTPLQGSSSPHRHAIRPTSSAYVQRVKSTHSHTHSINI